MADETGEITEDEFRRWLTPMRARQALSDQWGESTIRSTLAGNVGHGLLEARAAVIIIGVGGSSERRVFRHRVAHHPWSSESPSFHSDFWQNGRFDYEAGDYRNQTEIACHGVRFDPEGVQALIEPAFSSPAAPKLPQARRGAKRKDWWDHLWIEMIRRIRAGTLNPTNVADLQATLEGYAGNVLDQDYGDSTLKPMASNLFKYLQENGGK